MSSRKTMWLRPDTHEIGKLTCPAGEDPHGRINPFHVSEEVTDWDDCGGFDKYAGYQIRQTAKWGGYDKI